MLIADPTYDSVFKFLMEDLESAAPIISSIIGREVVALSFAPQEILAQLPPAELTVYRLDFSAVVRDVATGETKKVLIEMQKAKHENDIMRFRSYLGENYGRDDVVDGESIALPLVTIYFLGFKLSVQRPVLRVNRTYSDARTGEVLTERDTFIERLTHDSHVVQTMLLPKDGETKLDRLLSVFSGLWTRTDEGGMIALNYTSDTATTEDPDLQHVLRRLTAAKGDEDVRRRFRIERESQRSMMEHYRELRQELAAKEEALAVKDEALAVKDEALAANAAALAEKDRLIAELQLQLGIAEERHTAG
jgi:hypothetical protein